MQHVVSQLVDKRKEIEGEIIYHQKIIKTLSDNLKAIDISIRLFDSNIDLKEIKPKRFSGKQRYFNQGEAMILILDTLRVAKTPMTITSIVREVMTKKKMDIEDKSLTHRIIETLRMTLRTQTQKGVLIIDNTTDEQRWSMKIKCGWAMDLKAVQVILSIPTMKIMQLQRIEKRE